MKVRRKSPKYEEALAWNLFDISPVIDAKVRNIRTGLLEHLVGI